MGEVVGENICAVEGMIRFLSNDVRLLNCISMW